MIFRGKFKDRIKIASYEVMKLGYLVEKTSWTCQQIEESPAGQIQDLLEYFSAKDEEEAFANEKAAHDARQPK